MRAIWLAVWVMVLAGTFGWSQRGKLAPPASPGVHIMDGGSGEPPKP